MVNNRFQRWAGEVLFPLLGLLLWDWPFVFVAWFYFGDRFFQWIFNFIKKQKVKSGFWKIQSFITLELVLVVLIIIQSEHSIFKSLLDFLAYEDMGIAQGYFLIPLLVVGEWLKYKAEIKLNMFQIENNAITIIKIGVWGICSMLFLWTMSDIIKIIVYLTFIAFTNLWIDFKKVPVSYK